MDEEAHMSPTGAALARRSRVDRVLRLLLTVAVLLFVWNCIRMFRVIRETRDLEPYVPMASLADSPRDDTPQARQKQIGLAFPLPLYPGAREPEFGHLDINGNPFFRCDYEVAAPPEKVLRFYRRRLRGAGWTDTTEDLLNRSLRADDPSQSGVLDLQNETFLRYYDHMKRTQARFNRRGTYAVIAVAEGTRSYLTHVGVRYAEGGGPEAIARQLEDSLNPDGARRTQPMVFTQHFGKRDAMRTRIVSGRASPRAMRDNLVRTYLQDGWSQVEMPPEAAPRDGHGACLVRGQEMVIIHTTREEDAKNSKAIVTVIGAG